MSARAFALLVLVAVALNGCSSTDNHRRSASIKGPNRPADMQMEDRILSIATANVPAVAAIQPADNIALNELEPDLYEKIQQHEKRAATDKQIEQNWQKFCEITIAKFQTAKAENKLFRIWPDDEERKERIVEFANSISPLYCKYKNPSKFNILIDKLGRYWEADDFAKIAAINNVNKLFISKSDEETWGQIDYWATPCETLEKGEGDCEQYAMFKYLLAESMGISKQKLRIASVMTEDNIHHMVLLYFPQQIDYSPLPKDVTNAYVLDNRNPRILRFYETNYSYPFIFLTL